MSNSVHFIVLFITKIITCLVLPAILSAQDNNKSFSSHCVGRLSHGYDTVEPLYNRHHWEPTFVPYSEVSLGFRYISGGRGKYCSRVQCHRECSDKIRFPQLRIKYSVAKSCPGTQLWRRLCTHLAAAAHTNA